MNYWNYKFSVETLLTSESFSGNSIGSCQGLISRIITENLPTGELLQEFFQKLQREKLLREFFKSFFENYSSSSSGNCTRSTTGNSSKLSGKSYRSFSANTHEILLKVLTEIYPILRATILPADLQKFLWIFFQVLHRELFWKFSGKSQSTGKSSKSSQKISRMFLKELSASFQFPRDFLVAPGIATENPSGSLMKKLRDYSFFSKIPPGNLEWNLLEVYLSSFRCFARKLIKNFLWSWTGKFTQLVFQNSLGIFLVSCSTNFSTRTQQAEP